MVYDIVDECFIIMLVNGDHTGAAEKLIDEAADFQDEMLTKINAAKSKADFRNIRESLGKAAVDFVNRLNELN